MQIAIKYSLYDDLLALPDHVTGEILNGQLHTQPRPSRKHALVESNLHLEIGSPFHRGKGGPGGWWIIIEPEIHFIRDTEVCVPDLAGWRKERMPDYDDAGNDEGGYRFETVPDWICEILSPSTESKDRNIKMDIYARNKVRHVWLVDPLKKLLEAYELSGSSWNVLETWTNDEKVHVPPFQAIELELSILWN